MCSTKCVCVCVRVESVCVMCVCVCVFVCSVHLLCACVECVCSVCVCERKIVRISGFTSRYSHSITIEGKHSRRLEPCTNICWCDSFKPSTSKDATKVELRDNFARIFLIKLVAFLLPVPLQWPKKTAVERLILMSGVRREAKDDNFTIFSKLETVWLEMRTVSIQQ